jgi:hypothetical protein
MGRAGAAARAFGKRFGTVLFSVLGERREFFR